MVAGLTYNFLPFMVLPLYASLEQLDPRLLEAAGDLYAGPSPAFRRVTLPLSMPGVVAGTLLTFIPAAGDYINAELLGTPQPVHDRQRHPDARSWSGSTTRTAAALSFLLMAAILVLVLGLRPPGRHGGGARDARRNALGPLDRPTHRGR